MDIIQVTNPKFRPQTMRSIIVANARHELQLASQTRTLDYHRHNFLAKNERERKCLTAQLAEMTTIMEASRAREEEQRKAKERRRASLYERNELNVDRSVADDNAIQMMKKLIEAALEQSQAASPPDAGDGSVVVKSRASTAKRSDKMRSLPPASSTTGLKQHNLVSSTSSLAASESTDTASRKDLSTGRRRRGRSSATSRAGTPDQPAAASTAWKLTRQLKGIVSTIYSKGEKDDEETVDVAAIVSRLQPLVKRAVDDDGQPLTSLSSETDNDVGAGSEAFHRLKKVLSAEFSDAVTVEKEIEERTAQRLKNREKKLWEKFGTFTATNAQPLYQQKRSKFTARYWDFDTPIEITQTVTDKDWDELRYCRYLRQGLPKFCKDKQDI